MQSDLGSRRVHVRANEQGSISVATGGRVPILGGYTS